MDTFDPDRRSYGSRRSGGWLARRLARLQAADVRRRDAVRLASLPEHLLADMGLTRDAARCLHRSGD